MAHIKTCKHFVCKNGNKKVVSASIMSGEKGTLGKVFLLIFWVSHLEYNVHFILNVTVQKDFVPF